MDPNYSSSSTNGALAALAAYGLIMGIIAIAAVVFTVIVYWRICSRAGYSGAMSLLMFIPGVGSLILLCILAFGEWPTLRELNQRRMQQGMGSGNFQPAPQAYPGQPPFPAGPQYPR